MPIPFSALPTAEGLYDPAFERDACGVAFLADLAGRRGHGLVSQALTALRNLDHRGAAGAESSSGDGAGITTQVPDMFLRAVAGIELPPAGSYAVGTAFLPTNDTREAATIALVDRAAADEGLDVLGWRDRARSCRADRPWCDAPVPAGVPRRSER